MILSVLKSSTGLSERACSAKFQPIIAKIMYVLSLVDRVNVAATWLRDVGRV